MSTPGVSHPSPTTVEDFGRVLDERAVQPVFQPLIDLDNRHVVGYEALARGPMGSALETPAALFGAAWRAGRVAELDWACRAAAFTGAVRGGLGPPLTLFVNAEPVSLGEAARIVNAVRAQAERTDAVVVAEGIETIKHAGEAVAAGATIGQGFLFGHPAPLPSPLPEPGAAIPFKSKAGAAAETPWEVVAAAREPRRATRDLPVEMSMQLEHEGLDAAEPNVLLACFQEADLFTPAARSRFEYLATRAAFTGPLGHGTPVSPVAGVRGADLDAGDPLCREGDLVVIGPRFAAALVARDLGDDGPQERRRYDVAVTHDRDLVIRAAEPLLRRLVPER